MMNEIERTMTRNSGIVDSEKKCLSLIIIILLACQSKSPISTYTKECKRGFIWDEKIDEQPGKWNVSIRGEWRLG